MSNTGFPSDFVDPKQKETKDYGVKYFKAMYSTWRNRFNGEEKVKRYIENRKYAEGLQSTSIYLDLLGLTDTSYLNLNLSVVPIIPKYVDLLIGEFTNTEYRVVANAIDPISRSTYDDIRAEMITKMLLKPFNDQLKQIDGVGFGIDDKEVPQDMEEIELHLQMNARLDTEIAMEEMIKFIHVNNDIEEVKRKLYRDLIVLKKGAITTYVDENQNIKIRYIDPVNMIHSYSEKDDYSDIRYWGEVVYMDIFQLRRASKGQLSEEDLFEVAKCNSNKHNNREFTYGGSYISYYNSTYSNTGCCDYDDFLIAILDGEFHSINTKTFEEKDNNYGGIFYNERKFGYEPSQEAKKRKVSNIDIDYVYKGMWVIGTDYILDYGMKTDMIRPKKNGVYSPDTTLSVIMFSPDKYEDENKSLVERMIPHADAIQLISLKIQQLMAKMTPPGLAVDVSVLTNLNLGKGESTPLQALEIYHQTGNYFYNGMIEGSMPVNRQPISELHNSMGNALSELIGLYEFHKQQIRDITGINEERDASSFDKRQSQALAQMSLSNSRNSTKIISYSFEKMFNQLNKNLTFMIQDLVEKEGSDSLINVIGRQSYNTLDITKKLSASEFGIFIETLPSADERQFLEQNLQQSISTKELRVEDAITIRDISKVSIKHANQYLIFRRRKYQQEQEAFNAANSQQNAQVQQQSLIMTAEQDARMKQMEAQFKMQELQMKYDLENKNKEAEHQRMMDRLLLEGKIKSEHITQATDEEFKTTALNNSVKQPQVF